jgi:hypothetical protein
MNIFGYVVRDNAALIAIGSETRFYSSFAKRPANALSGELSGNELHERLCAAKPLHEVAHVSPQLHEALCGVTNIALAWAEGKRK